MSDHTVAELNQVLKDSTKVVNLGVSLQHLMANRDFQAVVLTGYLETEALRLVRLKAAPASQSPEAQQTILRGLDAIGAFHHFLTNVSLQAEIAEKTVRMTEESLDDLLARG